MNYWEAKRMDKILQYITDTKNASRIGAFSFKKINIKGLSTKKVEKSLYKIRKEHMKLPDVLINGSKTLFYPNTQHINDFLNEGGFQKIYFSRLKSLIYKTLVFLISLATLSILIYVNFIK